jgi:hypothetical protein
MNVRKSLSDLLDQHSKSFPPDYFGFYGSVSAILASGMPPRTFCEAFGAELKDYDNKLQEYSKRGENGEKLSGEELELFKEVFHKYKLLNGCAEKLPSEMRKLISELAGFPVMGM